MSAGRERNGRFGQGNRANPEGRPRRGRTVEDVIRREMASPLTVIENSKRKRISKLAANTKQIVNQGASGDLRAAMKTVDMAMKVGSGTTANAAPLPLTQNDRAIVERFIARLNLTLRPENDNDADA